MSSVQSWLLRNCLRQLNEISTYHHSPSLLTKKLVRKRRRHSRRFKICFWNLTCRKAKQWHWNPIWFDATWNNARQLSLRMLGKHWWCSCPCIKISSWQHMERAKRMSWIKLAPWLTMPGLSSNIMASYRALCTNPPLIRIGKKNKTMGTYSPDQVLRACTVAAKLAVFVPCFWSVSLPLYVFFLKWFAGSFNLPTSWRSPVRYTTIAPTCWQGMTFVPRHCETWSWGFLKWHVGASVVSPSEVWPLVNTIQEKSLTMGKTIVSSWGATRTILQNSPCRSNLFYYSALIYIKNLVLHNLIGIFFCRTQTLTKSPIEWPICFFDPSLSRRKKRLA